METRLRVRLLGSARSSKAEMASPVSGRKGVLKYGGFHLSCRKPIDIQYHLEPFGLDNLCRPMVEYRTIFWGCAAAGPPLVAAGPFAVRPYPSEPATEQEGDSL